MTTQNIQRQNDVARKAIRSLLEGNAPNGTTAEDCGPWAETVAALCAAHQEGGTEAIKAVFSALAEADPNLFNLVSREPEPRKITWTAAELLAATFPDPVWAVPDLIPEGLSTLAGRPKVGKSWLALQVTHAVGTGGQVLDRHVQKGKVLFLALEDSERRLQGRLQKQGVPSTGDIVFKLEWQHLGKGGLADLQTEIQTGGYSLVIVDTITRALGGADQMDLAEMSMTIGNLQHLAQTKGIAILLLDHHRKNTGMMADPIDDILGSTGKAAVVDAALGLYREKGKRGATLKGVGRDLDEIELSLDWDGLCCCWHLLGEAGQVRKDSLKADIVNTIRDLQDMGELSGTTRIATHLGKDKGNISRALAEMVRDGQVTPGEKEGRVKPWCL
jgi:hypothetical protein